MSKVYDLMQYAQKKLDEASEKSSAFLNSKELHAIRWATAYSENINTLHYINNQSKSPAVQRFINEPAEEGWDA